MAETQEIKTSGNFAVMAKDENGKDVETGEKVKREVAFSWNAPTDLDEARQMWGDDTVFQLAMQKAVIKVQDTARRELGKDENFDGSGLLNYIPEVGRRTPSKPRKPETLEQDFEKLSADDQLALIERLKAKIAGQGNGEAVEEAEPAGKKGKR